MLKQVERPAEYFDYKFILYDSFDKMRDKLIDYDGEYNTHKGGEYDVYTLCVKGIDIDKIRYAYNWVYDEELDEIPTIHGANYLTDKEAYETVLKELLEYSSIPTGGIVQII